MGSDGIADLRQRLAEKKRATADETSRLARTQFDNNIRAADELIKKGGALNLTKAEDSIKAAEKLIPGDKEIVNMRQKLIRAKEGEKTQPVGPPKKTKIGEGDVE